MKRILVISGSALLSLLCFAGVQAKEGLSGHVEATGKIIDISGNKAKFSEYGDPDSGITGGVEMKYDSNAGYLNFNADDVARDTQNFEIEAGQYEKFKLDAYYNEIQHNFDFDAKSFYSGVGTSSLTTTATSTSLPTNSNTWPSVFDYAVSRDQYGAGIKLKLLKPFFADFSVSQEDRSGIKAAGGYTGVSIELPEPVDYKTNTFQAEVGYGKNPFFASISYVNSSFDNNNQYLYFTNLANLANRTEFLSLPPNNTYSKLAFKGRVKLPLQSSIALSYGKSEAESDANLATSYLSSTTTRVNTLSDNLFNGKVDTTSYNIVLASSPLEIIDAKVFYTSYDKENKSDEILSSSTAGTFTNHLFDYEKKSYGIEAGLKLPVHVKMAPSYKHVNVERHRGDLPETEDNIYAIDVKWSDLDFLSVKAGYERMERDSPWHQLTLVTGTQASADAIEPYIRRFDAADQNRDTFKVGVDITPMERMNLGLGFRHKQTDYTETVFGLLAENSNGFNVSADLTVNDAITISGYADYEVATLDQTERQLASATAATTSPTDTVVGDSNYTWTANQKNKSMDYGLAANMTVIPAILSLRAQFDHVRSNGLADFTYYESIPTGYTNDTVDSQNWDDYSKNSIMLKATYNLKQNITLVGGYAYEHYKYNDTFTDGYSYVWNSSATSSNYLTGAGLDPSYNANVVFMSAKYKF